jgi:hypothetical protein
MIKCSRIPNLNRTVRYFSLLWNFPITTSAIYLKLLRGHVILWVGNLTGEKSCVFNDMSNVACSMICRMWRVQRYVEYGVFNDMSNVACSIICRIWPDQQYIEYGVFNDMSNMACSMICRIWRVQRYVEYGNVVYRRSLQMESSNSLTKTQRLYADDAPSNIF